MLGHKNIKTTQIYAKVTELKIVQDMSKLLTNSTEKSNWVTTYKSGQSLILISPNGIFTGKIEEEV